MKRLITLLAAAALMLLLAGCTKAAGGTYTLSYITADGIRIPPGGFGMHITLELDNGGVGTANYSGTVMDITWSDEGSTVVVTGPNGVLNLNKDGDALILHEDGTILFFTPKEED